MRELSGIKAKLLNTFLNIFARQLAKKRRVLISYNFKSQRDSFDFIRNIKEDIETWAAYNEVYQLYSAIKSVKKIKGDIAEVGVYKGGTGKVICKYKGDKNTHLFDTFEGLPKTTYLDDTRNYQGKYSTSFEEVKERFKNEKNVFFYKGLFPDTANPVKKRRFSLVHLDVDLYKSTIDSLKFFYPRLNRGGIIISHDYVGTKGVTKAFNDFFRNKPEPVIELSGTQCIVIKV
jgi:hypothetical protein